MPKDRPLFLLLAAMAFTAGCTTTTLEPALPTAEPAIPTQWPVLAEGGREAPLAVGLGWRSFFHDQRLQSLIARALDSNRDLRIALLAVEKARAQYRIQRAERLPRPGATGAAESVGGDVRSSENYSVGIGVTSFELDLFGRVQNLSDAALQQYFAQDATRRSIQMVLIAEIASRYLTLAFDHALWRLSQATLKNDQESFALIEKRYSLGAVSGLDVEQVRTRVESTRADVARYEGQIARDIHALTLLVGAPVEKALLPGQGTDLQTSLAVVQAGVPSEILLRRPDIQAAEHQLQAANANIGAARAAFFPSITLTGNAGVASTDLLDLFGKGSFIWSFSPRITVPIFQGERLQANVDSAVVTRDIALAQYEKAIQTGFREVADALASLNTLSRQYQAQTALAEAASRAEQLARLRYEAGRDSYLTVLDAQRTLYTAQQGLLTTALSEQLNRVALYKALGGGWKERDVP